MSKKKTGKHSTRLSRTYRVSRLRGLSWALPAASGLVFAATPAAQALQLYDGSNVGNNLEISLDITTSYSAFERVDNPSSALVSGANNPNGNDGDANFRHGLVGNVFSVLPVLDIKNGDFGMHFSGEYFLNTVYLQKNQNNEASTINPVLSDNRDFASETRQANGQNGRMLDAFVYNTWHFADDQSVTLKAGQQTLLWGQSLFFLTNGISGGQAPFDAVTSANIVNPEVQQEILPVGQIVATYKPTETYTLQGYYQYQWEPDSLQGVGSYFSTSDVVGPAGQRIIVPLGPFGNRYLNNTKALTPESQNAQFGLSVQAQYGNYDLGLFTERYDAKAPVVATIINLAPSGLPSYYDTPYLPTGGTYHLIYPRDIWLYGTSVSTTIGATNVAGELSLHTHNPLVTAGPSVLTFSGFGSTYTGNANSDTDYPVGNTVTALASFIYGSPGLRFVPGGITFEGELEYVDLIRVTAQKALLAPGRTNGAAAFDVGATPAYFNVLPNLNLSFPVFVKYNFAGSSRVDSTMNNGTGTYGASVAVTYNSTWISSLNYVGYFGKASANGLAASVSTSADRGYVSLNLQHTF